ncbi:RagB/SusD family nutrient uptake outer membrane protein [Mucilaginibacter conchicola]|uniref:RagB/SusD family nutrient uptake outer membrane protein n=1 Tax=Mucilaginibacter conchicola TaxID=2303333 RepID=A0A372NUI6_9SPHI|nr:RagB/SusD family nutrient uptake outer membrane protein [Mucilaginibacter conchicola]RFZ92875.1 RagB/SusD family nutrient uptake outer membrane protein [Mucilaginibacter conchicola]
MMKKIFTICVTGAVLLLAACKKDFLEQRPDKALLVPSSAKDFRALLDNTDVFNLTTGLTLLADGDLVATDAGWNNLENLQERNSYTWAADIFGTETAYEWDTFYQQVFYANVVLEGLDGLADNAETRQLRAEARFHRGFAFFGLAQQFAVPYTAAAAGTVAGIPLKLSAVVTEKAGRGTLAETYAQVLADLAAARGALPLSVPSKSRPSLAALYGLLARVYLTMEDYGKAGLYADSCLQLHPQLTDYNTLNAAAVRPFPPGLPQGTPEEIFYASPSPYGYISSASQTYLTPEFYGLFDGNDLRRTVFFRQITPGNFKFKGNYAGAISYFSGLASDELYLVRAECAARAGDAAGAVRDLNTLLKARYKAGTFVPLPATDAETALGLVLQERRKELVMRGLRWTDLRRLNTDPRFAVTLTRTVAGQVYTLAPGSKRYTYPLPPDELKLNPMPQNAR